MTSPKTILSRIFFITVLILSFVGAAKAQPQAIDWGLQIVFFSVGQADAIVLVSPNGDACVIDAGRQARHGANIARFLKNADENKVGDLSRVKLGFATHYDADHIGGFKALTDSAIRFKAFYDQGISKRRKEQSTYSAFLRVTGDLNDNNKRDDNEPFFVRKKSKPGLRWKLGDAVIRCVSVRGDTKGKRHDICRNPSCSKINENPGSLALLITLGNFQFYTAGDQTSDDWKNEFDDTEIAVIQSRALGNESNIDVLKVNHHGSDTSSGHDFVSALDPEIAIISAEFTGHRLPKLIAIKQLVESGALVYITGNGKDSSGNFAESSATDEDDGYQPPSDRIINEAGDIRIFVAPDGNGYLVIAKGDTTRFSTL